MSTVLQPAGQLPQPLVNEPVPKERGDGVIKFGVVGYGYWGPNVVRNLDQLDGSQVEADQLFSSGTRYESGPRSGPSKGAVSSASWASPWLRLGTVGVVTALRASAMPCNGS